MNIGDKAPEILGYDQAGNELKLSDFAGKKLVLYFYPKQNQLLIYLQYLQLHKPPKEYNKLILSLDQLLLHLAIRQFSL